jgi:hypothetical protein
MALSSTEPPADRRHMTTTAPTGTALVLTRRCDEILRLIDVVLTDPSPVRPAGPGGTAGEP